MLVAKVAPVVLDNAPVTASPVEEKVPIIPDGVKIEIASVDSS